MGKSRWESMVVELVRNKATGKFFVVLEDGDGPDFLVVTPEGKVKRLERRLFGPQDFADPGNIQWRLQLTEKQANAYEAYLDADH